MTEETKARIVRCWNHFQDAKAELEEIAEDVLNEGDDEILPDLLDDIAEYIEEDLCDLYALTK